MNRYIYIIFTSLLILSSCEEVIEIDLNSASPELVIEATIYQDSVCIARLTRTVNYFSTEYPDFVEDATVSIQDGNISEELTYSGNGFYRGNLIIGTPGLSYEIVIEHNGTTYSASSSMPPETEITLLSYSKSNEQSILNPEGKTGFTISFSFIDDPLEDNFYMISYTEEGNMIERRYFMLTENSNNGGSLEYTDPDIFRFSEFIFYNGGIVDVKLFTMDESVYNYFFQLDDILFWKRRYLPPVPYNPLSNFSNGALGYFAAWNYDTETIVLE
ncbi:MAG: DUF4249 domain-containing protein [Bacteroidales bacterium]|nr:DUF4249 domain-containing protein [Bacteroidales bacterium]